MNHIILPNGDLIATDAIIAIRFAEAIPESDIKPRVVVDYGARDDHRGDFFHMNSIILYSETADGAKAARAELISQIQTK